ncbi:MAG TPA: hypothetical protein VIC87_04745 [Vicinamibacteria bacterium]
MTYAAEDNPDDSTTLVRIGKTAMTFPEMAAFVRDLESRPVDRLLEDLSGLLALPDGQHGLVTMVLRKKMRASPADRDAIVARLHELKSRSDDATVRGRCQRVLDRPDRS